LAILEVCGPTGSVSKEDYLARELFYIDWALKEYGIKVLNILKIPQSSLGYKHTEETKKRMSESRSGEKNPMHGKEKSDEFIFHQKKDKFGPNNPAPPLQPYYASSRFEGGGSVWGKKIRRNFG
jgi:group I intron endonuclease